MDRITRKNGLRKYFLDKGHETIIETSEAVGIINPRFSLLINGRVKPTAGEKVKLIAFLGKHRYRKFFEPTPSPTPKIVGNEAVSE